MDTTSIRTPSTEVPLGNPLRHEKPKLAVCAGCGGKYPHRELVELTEDNHDNLTYFHGDHLCRSCADGAGVEH